MQSTSRNPLSETIDPRLHHEIPRDRATHESMQINEIGDLLDPNPPLGSVIHLVNWFWGFHRRKQACPKATFASYCKSSKSMIFPGSLGGDHLFWWFASHKICEDLVTQMWCGDFRISDFCSDSQSKRALRLKVRVRLCYYFILKCNTWSMVLIIMWILKRDLEHACADIFPLKRTHRFLHGYVLTKVLGKIFLL